MEEEDNLNIVKPIQVISNIISFIAVTIITVHTIYGFKNTKKKIDKSISYSSVTMFIASTLSLFWRIITKLPVNTSMNCLWIHGVLTMIYTTVRCSYYVFLTYRLEVSFRESILKINLKFLKIFRYVIVVISGILGIWNTAVMSLSLQINVPGWGIYCKVEYPKSALLPYAGFDFIISVVMCYLFVSRLFKFSKLMDISVDSLGMKQSKKLLNLVKIITILTIISIISTWFFIIGGFLVFPPLNWVLSIDYIVNVLCIYLMFDFVHLRKRWNVATDIGCFCSQYWCWCWCCIPFKYICWNQDIRQKMNRLDIKTYKFSTSSIGSSKDNSRAPSINSGASSTSKPKLEKVISMSENTNVTND